MCRIIKFKFLLFNFICFYYQTNAQSLNFCGTSFQTQKNIIQLAKNKFTSSEIESNALVYIPIQVHMVLNDNGTTDMGPLRLRESICTLNSDFLPTGFQFYMEDEVHYILSSKWNDHDYNNGLEMMRKNNVSNVVNVYLVNNPAGNCGYFTYDGDAVALSKSCTGKASHTWAHEFGHYFSLPHTFFGWEGINYESSKPTSDYQNKVFTRIESLERLNCQTQADNFCDTNPDYISYRWGCNGEDSSMLLQFDVNGKPFRSDGSLYMSYASDNCMSRFSDEQMRAMRSNYNTSRTDLHRNTTLKALIKNEPYQISPIDSSITKTNVGFYWDKVENAEAYLFQLSKTSTFTVLIRNTTLSQNYLSVDSLLNGKRYYWRIIPICRQDFCTDVLKSATFLVDINASINYTESDNLIIYPNPVMQGQVIEIHLQNHIDQKSIKIFTANGVVVNDITELQFYQNSVILNTSKLQPGVYAISIQNKFYKLLIQ